MGLTVPTMLTLARLAAAPGLAVVAVALERPAAEWWALGLFLAAAATDWLDGWLARRLGQESALGAVLDPIADKAMTVIALAVLTGLTAETGPGGARLDPWVALPAAAILLREIAVAGLREALGPGAGLAVTRLAKWKTAAQMGAIAAMLAAAPLAAAGLAGAEPAARALLWLAAALTLVTGWDYAAKAVAYIRGREDRRCK